MSSVDIKEQLKKKGPIILEQGQVQRQKAVAVAVKESSFWFLWANLNGEQEVAIMVKKLQKYRKFWEKPCEESNGHQGERREKRKVS